MTLWRGILGGIILCAAVASCGSHTKSPYHLSGVLIVNGPGISDGILLDHQRVYSLQGIVAGNDYTLRTIIASSETDTVPGTLSGDIYRNSDDYLFSASTATAIVASLTSQPSETGIYEATFHADVSGDYLIAVSGAPNRDIEQQFFYDLRLLSSSVTTTFATAPTATVAAANTASIVAGYVHIYSGGTVSSGTYTVGLTTNLTTTISAPQMFIYSDGSLKTESLLYSSYATTVDYILSSSATGTSASAVNAFPNVPFSATGPYIMIRGNTSLQYTLTVSP